MHAPSLEKPLLGCRLLLVEDNVFVAQIVVEFLEEAGSEIVGPFPKIIDALERLSDLAAIDGAILDVGLDQEEVYPLALALQTTRIPFMFLTGVSRESLPEQFSRAPYMQKPFKRDELLKMLVDMGVRQTR